MKTHLKYLAIAVLALAACNKETVQQFEKKSLSLEKPTDALILKAHYGQPSSKSAISDAGAFTWTDGDEISVWTRNKNKSLFMTYSLLSGAGTNDAEFFGALSTSSVSKVAVFPAALSPSLPSNQSTSLTITLPKEYAYVESVTNSPMIAQVTDAQTPLSFKHLAGLIKLTVDNIPSYASALYFSTPGVKISGSYTIDYTASNAILETAASASDGSDEYVLINFTPTGGPMTFYVPLPVGNYEDGFMLACLDDEGYLTALPYYYEKPFSVERADLLLAPEAKLWREADDILARYDGPYEDEGTYYSAFSFLTAGPSFKYAIFPFNEEDLSASTLLLLAEYVAEGNTLYDENKFPLYSLDPGSYIAFMVAFDEQGNCLNTYSYALANVVEITDDLLENYNKWIGTWSISGIDLYEYLQNHTETNITFSGITISQNIAGASYTVAHWESDSNPISDWNWDTAFGSGYQPTFTAKYDAASGKLIFVAEIITGLTMSGETYYLSFNDYWPYNDGDELAEATLAANGTNASISSLNDCYSLGYYIFNPTTWKPRTWGYSFYIAPNTPTPATMTKTSSATSSTGAPIALQNASAPRRVLGKERVESLSVSLPSVTRKELPAALKKK